MTCNVLWMYVLSYLFYDTWHLYILKKAKCSILPLSLFSSTLRPARMSWEVTYGTPKGNSTSSLGFTMNCRRETLSFKEKKADIDSAEDGVMLNGCLTVCKGIVCQCFQVLFSLLCFSDFFLFQLPCHFIVNFPYCIFTQFDFIPSYTFCHVFNQCLPTFWPFVTPSMRNLIRV